MLALDAHAARLAAGEEVVVVLVSGDVRRDEPTEQHDSRDANGCGGMMQATLRPDVRARELQNRARKANRMRRDERHSLEAAHVTPSDLNELAWVSVHQSLPAIPEPCFVVVADSLDVGLDQHLSAVLAPELKFGRRELDVRRRRTERLPRPPILRLGSDVRTVAAAVHQHRLGVAERRRDVLVADPDVVAAQAVIAVNDRDRARQRARLTSCHQFVAPAHAIQSRPGRTRSRRRVQ